MWNSIHIVWTKIGRKEQSSHLWVGTFQYLNNTGARAWLITSHNFPGFEFSCDILYTHSHEKIYKVLEYKNWIAKFRPWQSMCWTYHGVKRLEKTGCCRPQWTKVCDCGTWQRKFASSSSFTPTQSSASHFIPRIIRFLCLGVWTEKSDFGMSQNKELFSQNL